MRLLPGAAGAVGVLLLLVLLTWLLLRGTDTNAPAYATTLRAFDDFALAEASLDRDLLEARAGLLRDYDALVSSVRAMEARPPGFGPTPRPRASTRGRPNAWPRRSRSGRS